MRLAILSDIHANLEAFTSVLADIDSQRTKVDEILSLGDIIGYGPDPEACIQLLRARNIRSVQGNHELGVARSKYRNWFNSQSREALKRTCELVSEETVAFIRDLPTKIVRYGCLFVHGLPPSSSLKYLYEIETEKLPELFTRYPEQIAFIGHTHELELITWDTRQVIRSPLGIGSLQLEQENRYLINIGAVGQPRDGDNRAKYVIWDTETWELTVRFVSYNVEKTIAKFKEQGMPKRYADRLR